MFSKKSKFFNRVCGDSCPRCVEKCLNACEHRQCDKKCWMPCTIKPCIKPCQKLLPCSPKNLKEGFKGINSVIIKLHFSFPYLFSLLKLRKSLFYLLFY